MSNRAILITGGSRGIGAATARLAARSGYAVAINYQNNRDAAQSVAEEIRANGGVAHPIQADIGNEQEVLAMFESFDEHFGELAGLVNSAGLSSHMMAKEADAQSIERLLQVNIFGVMLACREAIKRMSSKGGSIVNISSMAAFAGGRPGASHYAASKGAWMCLPWRWQKRSLKTIFGSMQFALGSPKRIWWEPYGRTQRFAMRSRTQFPWAASARRTRLPRRLFGC